MTDGTRHGSDAGQETPTTSSRRTLLKGAAATAAATGLSTWAGRVGADRRDDDDDDDDDDREERRRNRRSGRQPNILLILVDEMRYPPIYESATLQQFPFKGGVLVPNPDFLVPLTADGDGHAALPAVWPMGLPQWTTVWLQAWAADGEAALGWISTDGLGLTQIVP